MSRRGARLYHTIGNRDRNERPIIDVLTARGFSVRQLRGKGIPDLLVGKARRMWLVEIKRPKVGRSTPAQVEALETWTGPEPVTLRTVEEAMAWEPA
jgi:Holliday junction resolvase